MRSIKQPPFPRDFTVTEPSFGLVLLARAHIMCWRRRPPACRRSASYVNQCGSRRRVASSASRPFYFGHSWSISVAERGHVRPRVRLVLAFWRPTPKARRIELVKIVVDEVWVHKSCVCHCPPDSRENWRRIAKGYKNKVEKLRRRVENAIAGVFHSVRETRS